MEEKQLTDSHESKCKVKWNRQFTKTLNQELTSGSVTGR